MKSTSISALALAALLCQSCLHSANTKSETSNQALFDETFVDLCALSSNAGKYRGMSIQTSGVLITGKEYTYLYDPSCAQDVNLLWYELKTDDARAAVRTIISADNPEYRATGLIRAKAKFTGTFEVFETGVGPDGFFKKKLIIYRVTDIETVPSEVPYPWEHSR